MTPYELNVRIQAYANRKKVEGEEALTSAYLTAYWQRVKRMPDLKKLLDDTKQPQNKKSKEQTPEQMFAAVKAAHAAFGGE
jgi:hypothetical protein